MAVSRRFAVVSVVTLMFVVLTIVPTFVGFVTDLFWFREIGYETVFFTELTTKVTLFLVAGLVTYAFLALNARLARSGPARVPVLWRMSPELPPVDVAASLSKIATPLVLVLSFLFALGAAGSWMDVLRYMNRLPFGVTDPVFSRDVGFYVFVLPVLATLLGSLRSLVILALFGVVVLYVLRGRISLPPQRITLSSPADGHVAALLVGYLLLTALQIWLVRIPELLYSNTGPLVGASYTDLHAKLPALHAVAGTAIIAIGLVIYGMLRGRIVWFTLVGAAAYVIVSILAGGIYPYFIQRFVVAPTELTRELPQLRNHINATRQAWGLANVETRDLTGDAGLSLDDIRANAATIQNVRLWDRAPLLQTFGQLQEIRTYYDFVSVDDDRYVIDGRYRQVLLSPRELNAASLPKRTFINQHLTFTHGLGLTLGPVNEVTAEGLPVLYIKNLPPVSTVSLKVTRPQLYFGELTDEHVFVNTAQPEFDYPSGNEDVYTRYKGTGGVRVGGFIKRSLLAMRFGALNILFSGDITSESRVLYNRQIEGRVREALPFIRFDSDPYLVIDTKGELYWIVDGFTSSSRYPYSQRLDDGTSYMRNSIKVTVDAYNGTVTAYVADPSDPLIRTYGRIFPGILKPLSAMPTDIRAHIRYPRDLFRVQTELYATYHMDEAKTFYNREDQWQIPATPGQKEDDDRFMRHLVMRLPDEKQAEYIYMAPFTPRGKNNLAAWMVARNDGASYGHLRVYRFPKQSLVYGPLQISSRINQDTDISRELTLWDQRGSQVIKGELLVIPVEEALIYVQPIYLRAEGGQIPELKRVVVAFQDRVVMSETLESGLTRLFAGQGALATRPGAAAVQAVADTARPSTLAGAAPAPPATAGTAAGSAPAVSASLLREAEDHYQRAMSAQRAGDWATYGQEIQRLGEVLRRLNAGGR
ncbi:MAG TPA: UPF0182 family protein [Gemmatimonadaceae bacterium]|nr:UPF0182 family protein [Gemmatimonadaceae bacterium]